MACLLLVFVAQVSNLVLWQLDDDLIYSPLLKLTRVGFFINPSKIRAFKLRRSVMFVEKQPTKILSSVGAICKKVSNTYLFTCRSSGAFAFLPFYTTNI
jgi:hypothetical protein